MMTGKSESLYDLIFAQVLRKLDTLFPGDATSVRLMISDYEFAILNSSKRAFPQGRARGCWFHFGQVFYVAIQISLYAIMLLTISFLILGNLSSGVQ